MNDGLFNFSLATTYSSNPCGISTIGAGGLNYRIRNGNGCTPAAMATKHIKNCICNVEEDKLPPHISKIVSVSNF